MSSEELKAHKTPLEDLRREALEHYEQASLAIHHWSSFVHNAIKAYNPDDQPSNSEGWVRVEDEKPEEGERVFIASKTLSGKVVTDIAFYTYGGKQEFDDEDDYWPDCYDEKQGVSFLQVGFWAQGADEEKCYQRTVTHWLKLPPPPNK